MNKYAVIVAGGSGTRMGASVPKQFLHINGKPILWYTIQTFLLSYEDLRVILVLPAGTDTDALYDPSHAPRIQVTEGGETRFHSVQNGLHLVPGNETSVVFVHDGVRCNVSIDLIHRCYEKAIVAGTAVPAVASQDSVRIVDGENNSVIDRNKVQLIQTPQTFLSTILIPAFQQDHDESFTDEATVVEKAGHKIQLVEGDHSNIKVTRPLDLLLVEHLITQRFK